MKIYRSKDVPWRIKCRRMVEQCILLRERKLVLENSDPGQNQRMGDKGCEAFVQIGKKRG